MKSYSIYDIIRNLNFNYHYLIGGRLDRASDTELVWAPYQHGSIGLHSGNLWSVINVNTSISITTSGTTISGGSFTSDTNYDVYACYESPDSFSLQLQEWAGDNARYEMPSTLDGVLVKNPDTVEGRKCRFLGVVRLNNSGYFADTDTERFVFNLYNKKRTSLWTRYSTWSTITYSTSSWNEYNNGTDFYRAWFVSHGAEDITMYATTEVFANTTSTCYLTNALNATSDNCLPRIRLTSDSSSDNMCGHVRAAGSSVEGLNYYTLAMYSHFSANYEGGYGYNGGVAEWWC